MIDPNSGFVAGAIGGAAGGALGWGINKLMNIGSTKAGNTAKGEGGDETATLTLDEQKQMWDEMSSVSPDDGPGLSYGGPRTRKQLHNQTKQYRNTKVVKQGTRLDKSTTGKNLFGLTYAGSNNPRTYDGRFSFSFVPTNQADYPAIGHDRRYANLKIEGASGLFLSTKSIGADWHFVLEEMFVVVSPTSNMQSRAAAFAVGMGLGLFALPKTIYGLYTVNGRNNAIMWYIFGNKGVTNNPSPRR